MGKTTFQTISDRAIQKSVISDRQTSCILHRFKPVPCANKRETADTISVASIAKRTKCKGYDWTEYCQTSAMRGPAT